MLRVGLNCDMGEGAKNEAQLMPYISACSIACGGHYGNASTIQSTIALAIKDKVFVGAHPSYPDKENFGRKSLEISKAKLIDSIRLQLDLFKTVSTKVDLPMHHIKAHGALYNDIAKDEAAAKMYLEAIAPYCKNCQLYVPHQSAIKELALSKGFQLKYEAFADRNYNNDLQLVSRKHPDATIQDSETAFNHVFKMISEQKVKTVNQKTLSITASTFCIHSDNPKALPIAKHLYQNLMKKGIHIE